MFNHLRYCRWRIYLLKHTLNRMGAIAAEASDEMGRFAEAISRYNRLKRRSDRLSSVESERVRRRVNSLRMRVITL